jgi:hypothetical protein
MCKCPSAFAHLLVPPVSFPYHFLTGATLLVSIFSICSLLVEGQDTTKCIPLPKNPGNNTLIQTLPRITSAENVSVWQTDDYYAFAAKGKNIELFEIKSNASSKLDVPVARITFEFLDKDGLIDTWSIYLRKGRECHGIEGDKPIPFSLNTSPTRPPNEPSHPRQVIVYRMNQ